MEGSNYYGVYATASMQYSPDYNTGYNYGVFGGAGNGERNYGVFGSAWGGTNNWAGYFYHGNVHIKNDLGIGTTTPSQKLDVNGNAHISGDLTVDGSFPNIGYWRLRSNDNPWLNDSTTFVAGANITLTQVGDTIRIAAVGGAGDNDWMYHISNGADTTLMTAGKWGIARFGNRLYGSKDSTHVNLGVACTTGNVSSNERYCTVSGGRGNKASAGLATVGGGDKNKAEAAWATVSGGGENEATEAYATISGGGGNYVNAYAATVSGGVYDSAKAEYATVCGGMKNTAGYEYAFVGGGWHNRAIGGSSTIGGGSGNYANAPDAVVAGGNNNEATGWYSTVSGGKDNYVTGNWSTVSGGDLNGAERLFAVVGGGYENIASDTGATIGGGANDTASGYFSTVSGGDRNAAKGEWTAVGGGLKNKALGDGATNAGGAGNNAYGGLSTVAGGQLNLAYGGYSVVAGGNYNTAGGSFSVVAGGDSNYITESSHFSLAFGKKVSIDDDYRVVFFDGTKHGRFGLNRDYTDGGVNHPIHVGTNTSNGNGAYLTAGGTWTNTSSRSFKNNFQELDGSEVVEKIMNMAVTGWNYRDTDEKHIGPVAEDFYDAFECGTGNIDEDRMYIAASDMAGVGLIAIKELVKQNNELRLQLEELKKRTEYLEKLVIEK